MKALTFLTIFFFFGFLNLAFAEVMQPLCKVDKIVAAPNERIVFTPSMPSSTDKFKYKWIGEASTTNAGPIGISFIFPGSYTLALQAVSSGGNTYSSLCPAVTIKSSATSSFSNTGSFYPYPFTSTTTIAQIPTEVPEAMPSCFNLIQNLSFGYYDDVQIPTDGVIWKLQKFLIAKKYLKADASGYFGPLTREAVKAFQLNNDIEPTGFVGPLTRGRIKSVSCGI